MFYIFINKQTSAPNVTSVLTFSLMPAEL